MDGPLFIGKIPKQLLNLRSLSFLNLSVNELVGCIPRGKQFNTFENNSYQGNDGLRGFPLSRDCSNNEPPQPPPSNLLEEEEESKSNIAFSWKIVAIGYGFGVIFGLAVGYVVFRTGEPKWIVTLVENQHHKSRKSPRLANAVVEKEGPSLCKCSFFFGHQSVQMMFNQAFCIAFS